MYRHRLAGVPAVVSRTGWSGGLGYEVFRSPAIAQCTCEIDSWRRTTARNDDHRTEDQRGWKGVTDTAYYSNSGMNPYEAGQGRLVDLNKVNSSAAMRCKIVIEGAKRKTVGVLIEATCRCSNGIGRSAMIAVVRERLLGDALVGTEPQHRHRTRRCGRADGRARAD